MYLQIVLLLLFIIMCILLIMWRPKTNPTQECFQYRLGTMELPFTAPKLFRNLLSEKECDVLIEITKKKGLSASQIRDYQVDSEHRKSDTCWLFPEEMGPVWERLSQFLKNELKGHEFSSEPVQIVRYGPGQYFRDHYDQCEQDEPWCRKETTKFGGPRLCTLLIYLNDSYKGGFTEFPLLNQRWKGKKGDAIFFWNLDQSKRMVHPKSKHRGTEVFHGEKWIANIWIRDKKKKI